MKSKKSAGILPYRINNKGMEVFLVHPGGPFWAKKDMGSWSIPKGEFNDEEDPLTAAKREFFEEVGFELEGKFTELTPVKMKSGKIVYAWAIQSDFEAEQTKSNTFELEWPPGSGKRQEFPEIDKGEWFSTPLAKQKINKHQKPLIDELENKIDGNLKDDSR